MSLGRSTSAGSMIGRWCCSVVRSVGLTPETEMIMHVLVCLCYYAVSFLCKVSFL
jgi:hypothetical protein